MGLEADVKRAVAGLGSTLLGCPPGSPSPTHPHISTAQLLPHLGHVALELAVVLEQLGAFLVAALERGVELLQVILRHLRHEQQLAGLAMWAACNVRLCRQPG